MFDWWSNATTGQDPSEFENGKYNEPLSEIPIPFTEGNVSDNDQGWSGSQLDFPDSRASEGGF